MRILLVDDHDLVRRGIAQLLRAELGEVTIGEAGDSASALDQLDRGWTIVVLDISLPGRGGIDLLGEIKRLQPDLPVLILSGHAEQEYAVRAMRMGAAGYLSKSAAPEELPRAIRTILAGAPFVTPATAEALVAGLRTSEQPKHARLSTREFEVLRMIGAGRTVGDIATELSLSEKTVSTYRSRILDKLELGTTSELIRYALVHQLA